MNASQRFVKRAFDIAASGAGLAVFSVPILFIALCLKLTSRGPVFFRQERIGKNGNKFLIVKFRTMVADAERHGSITTSNDGRVTPAGRILRMCKLDELPQLWNVLVGKMSLVGPRPDVPGYADALKGEYRRILELRPGITGPASLYFRDEEDLLASQENPREFNDTVIWPKKTQLNLAYAEQWGFWKDIGYILVTLLPVLDYFFRLIPRKEPVFLSNVKK